MSWTNLGRVPFKVAFACTAWCYIRAPLLLQVEGSERCCSIYWEMAIISDGSFVGAETNGTSASPVGRTRIHLVADLVDEFPLPKFVTVNRNVGGGILTCDIADLKSFGL